MSDPVQTLSEVLARQTDDPLITPCYAISGADILKLRGVLQRLRENRPTEAPAALPELIAAVREELANSWDCPLHDNGLQTACTCDRDMVVARQLRSRTHSVLVRIDRPPRAEPYAAFFRAVQEEALLPWSCRYHDGYRTACTCAATYEKARELRARTREAFHQLPEAQLDRLRSAALLYPCPHTETVQQTCPEVGLSATSWCARCTVEGA